MDSVPPLYFDHNATSPLGPGVLDAMLPLLEARFHNPSSTSEASRDVRVGIETARQQVARLMGAEKPTQVLFSSGGTESIHAAFHAACHRQAERRTIIHSAADHSATKGASDHWRDLGFEIIELGVDGNGLLPLAPLQDALASQPVALVSLILANNETGAIQDLTGFDEAIRESGARWHIDAIQAPGKLPMRCAEWGADWVSISGHKFGAPKGIGALYERSPQSGEPWLRGGGQEDGRRGGTENVAGIIGLGCAAESARERAEGDQAPWAALRDRLEARLSKAVPGARVHAEASERVPNTSFMAIPGCPAEFLLPLLESEGLLCSAGSACDASHWSPSPVLIAMGVDEGEASCSLRFSLGPAATLAEVERAAEIVIQAHGLLNGDAPAASNP